ncbi:MULTISPECIES: 1-aminocyclopropane-1-carboxylate deaminase/D-cysteine desulfhydrase [unclassified Campylobacter]|uniref:1-aminocyclopropane-1-carboxylate deaminase/D-cysteine desulfhydrase n=1 Tax=unclassified Campylobacter TaxID=2593542 RepID=UPI001237AE80|nr:MULTISPECIES: 1-aminocyclopropane-1-carboxylate deaminase/D-cysteine desulfhydrase [unclassified Campylobacter]KAA6224805.1 1-aminocyclopropane-1-carboxylate deaminase/D-cysteine desulfhydrase [Campylobacter sp. LR185c]KAA6227380.1 1-aminocyclopropane-1-carboxylate deaminase/D-cysteine desulfhydrase [Campylobacter sp. LR196d]KAA6228757.1 1-aminocyclopropane-1-carboxylate deaminase/D-cysteine desulfhydrase [Campylobacter sp. LR286c]KAA6229567.1 1-aminocyclopropane-1-carboxylate deaminase/D-cy
MNLTRIDKIKFKGFEFYVKRDDELGLINGNKARKLAFFMSKNYPKGQGFLSYGGTQSNALLALAIFTKQRDYKLNFVHAKISNFLKNNPCGNYLYALNYGTNFIENTSKLSLKEFAYSLKKDNEFFLNEGIAQNEAEFGYKELAKEIELQARNLNIEFDIFLPSGTGTSAAFLAKHSKFKVFTTFCVGDEIYLKDQILTLIKDYDFSNLHILSLDKKYHFAKPYAEFIKIYKEILKQTQIEFDLLYDSLGLLCILKHKNIFKNPLLYIHQGGLIGNISMLKRYEFKKFM